MPSHPASKCCPCCTQLNTLNLVIPLLSSSLFLLSYLHYIYKTFLEPNVHVPLLSWFLIPLLILVGGLVGILASTRFTTESPFSHPHTIPNRLILVRHGQSQGNVNSKVYETTPDNQIHLTAKGFQQATKIGQVLHSVVGSQESIRFYVSPYVRTRETLAGIAEAWGGVDQMQCKVSSLPQHNKVAPNNSSSSSSVKWSEDPRIREQDFGNFQDANKMKEEFSKRNRFSRFFYRFENGGESAADVYDRVSLFLESLYRHWKRKKGHLEKHTTIVVAHGITTQVFFMRWFQYSVDEFLQYANPLNCEAAVLEREYDTVQCRYRLVLKYIVGPDGIRIEKRKLRDDVESDGRTRMIYSSKAALEAAEKMAAAATEKDQCAAVTNF